ncbi:MAG: hypothetical protein P1V36_02945 [Planctomycetota bacterium]|nr:hypothetical protein [Planctomycetota bacterium]
MRLGLIAAALLGLCALHPTKVLAAESAAPPASATYEGGQVERDDEGRPHGAFVRLHAHGVVAVRASYHHGLLKGLHKTYDEAGRLLVQKTYRRGELHGSWKDYHPNKRLKLTANYRHGKLHGTYLVRDPKGLTVLKTTYKEGLLHGKLQAFEGRRKISEQRWKQGVALDVDGVTPFPRAKETITGEVQRLLAGDGVLSEDPLEADRELALRYLKAYRCISGVPYDDIAIDAGHQAHAQAAAEVCRDLGHITHFPKNPGWDGTRFDFAAVGTKSSNLAQGMIACESIRGYMDDSDARNIAKVGHRAWCINPRMTHTGFGTVDRFSAMWSISSGRTKVPDHDVVACPGPGYAPGPWFGTHWAWSASLDKKRWDAPGKVDIEVVAVDAMFLPQGEPLALDHQSVLTKSAGTPYMLVFRPVGFSLKPGTRYRVTVDGLSAKGKPRALRYYVEFFDLAYVTPRVPRPKAEVTSAR